MNLPGRDDLEQVVRIPGVRSAVVASVDDGLVVLEASMEGVNPAATAALAASLLGKLRRAGLAAGFRPPALIHLTAERGTMIAVPLGEELIAIAVAGPGANVGQLRLALRSMGRAR